MKIRNKMELSDFIMSELSWRRHELTNIKSLVERGRSAQQSLIIRSSVVMLYSHWEGFVKNTARAFLSFLMSQGYKYSELKHNFWVAGMLNVAGGENSQINTWRSVKLYDFMTRDCINDKFFVDEERYVNAKGNLNSEVFKEIIYRLGLPESKFMTYYIILDSSLLKRRNEIAHGENTAARKDSTLDIEGFLDLYNKVQELINTYHVELENYIHREEFLASRG